MDQDPKQQIIERLNQTTNVLVTVSNNPSVDQLAACIGLTLFLNKQGKHATAVFSGKVPSTLQFLKPETTLEANTDSLRDFIIALDKSKADKLRYKVEDKVVKIFITPYRTSLSDKDLNFSQGDFNVDVVVAIGVHAREDLDQAITAHGRILHDATVVCINNAAGSNLGAINWQDPEASSLSEMLVDLAEGVKADNLDGQIATAFLTGIVAETERFSNEKTSPHTMSLSAKLMGAGANQQLVATELQAKPKADQPTQDSDNTNTVSDSAQPDEPSKTNDGALTIEHSGGDGVSPENPGTDPPKSPPDDNSTIHIDEHGELSDLNSDQDDNSDSNKSTESTEEKTDGSTEGDTSDGPHLTLQPPTLGGTLTASGQQHAYEPTSDPLSLPNVHDTPILSHSNQFPASTPPPQQPLTGDTTLASLEESVASPHLAQAPPETTLPVLTPVEAQTAESPLPPLSEVPQPDPALPELTPNPVDAATVSTTPDLDSIRDQVQAAANASEPSTLPPIESLGSQQPLNVDNTLPEQPVDMQTTDNLAGTPPPPPIDDSVFPATSPAPAAAGAFPNIAPVQPPVDAPLPEAPSQPPPPQVFPPATPQSLVPPDPGLPPEQTGIVTDPTAPPPVPPPMLPPTQ